MNDHKTKNSELIASGLSLVAKITAHNLTADNETAVAHQLHRTPELTATLIAQRQSESDLDHTNLVKLYQNTERHFNDSDLRDICFQLKGVDYENLEGSIKRDKARELVLWMQRNGRLPELTDLIAKLRPKVSWQSPSQQIDNVDIVSKLNVAVVVDIARPTIQDVARYLDDEAKVDANFILLQNTNPDKFLSPDDKWDAYVKAFSYSMNSIKRTTNGAQLHFFLSAPGALIFGLGCIWGTVDDANVYHYQSGSYHPVISVSRNLRS